MRSTSLLARLAFVETFVDAVVVRPFYADLRRVAAIPLQRPRPRPMPLPAQEPALPRAA